MVRRRSFGLAVGAAVAVVGSAVLGVLLMSSGSTGPRPTHVDGDIAALQTAVGKATDAGERSLLQTKLGDVQRERNEELNGRAADTTPNNAAAKAKIDAQATAAAAADHPLPHLPWLPAGDGFIVEGSVPLVSKDISVRNNWFREEPGNTQRAVYAGALAADPSQGVLVVGIEGADGPSGKAVGKVLTPERHGALRVTGATASVLTVVATDGTSYQFDVDAMSLR